jgi:SAM-dependent methyltransferase
MPITRTQAATALALAAAAWLATAPAAAQEEVPFITTPDRVTLAMLELAEVRASDSLIDLGSGDGRIVITAAKRFGARGLGVEIVPDLVERSRQTARQAGVETRARFLEQDLFKTDLSQASVITMYLLPDVNLQLRPALLVLRPGTRIVSHDWDMGDWKPDRTVTLSVPEKTIGRDKLSRVHLWRVPAPVEGLWCGPRGARWQITQQFQRAEVAIGSDTDRRSAPGRLTGARLDILTERGPVSAQWLRDGVLRVSAAPAPWQAWRGQTWQRAEGAQGCPG